MGPRDCVTVAEAKPRKRLLDEEIVAAVVQVILDEGTIASQTRLAQLVNRALGKHRHVTPERVRVLAVRSGLVGVTIRTRHDGAAGELETCPVCRSKLKRTANRTLMGSSTQTGYKCSRCPWWTGREMRIPHHYTFTARVKRGQRSGQLNFL